jgi:hypothetical protein
MAKQVSDFLIERLLEWNIKRIFGFPGDGINGILGALDRAKDKMDFIQVRHEENAFHGMCPFQIYRRSWCLFGNFLSGCHSSFEWIV